MASDPRPGNAAGHRDTPTPAELKQWREASGLTQAGLASALCLPERGGQVTVSRWESGARPIPADLWRLLRDIETYGP